MDTAPATVRAAKRAGRAGDPPGARAEEESASLRILRRPERLRQELARLQERRRACWDRCTRMGQSGGGERVRASRNVRGQEDSLAALADTEKKLRETREALAAAIGAAEALLGRLESMPGIRAYRDARLLRLRYMDGLNWQDVRANLRRNGFPSTIRNLFFWRGAALKQLDCMLLEKGGDCLQTGL